MPVPFRFVHFLGGLGTASTSGMGIAGWQAWEEYNPTGDRRLRREGYFYGPIRFDENVLNVSTHTGTSSNKFFSKSYECFNKLFGVSDYVFDAESADSGVTITLPDRTLTGDSDYIGCTTMQLSHGPQNQGFVFLSETVVKNNQVGMVVWAGAKNVKFASDPSGSSGDAYFRYYVLFLEKSKSTWSIKGGALWDDYTATQYADAVHVKIASPGKSLNGSYPLKHDSNREQPSEENWKYKRYSGIWEPSDSEGSGSNIFEEVEVLSVQSSTEYPEILGTNGEFTGVDNGGYACINNAYFVEDKKWKRTNGYVHFTSILQKWYQPFRDKKGHWKHLNDYCLSQSRARNISMDQEKFLREFCYRQNGQ